MERLRVTVSFKNNAKDVELYTWLDEMDDRSYFIKKVLREYHNKEKAEKEAKK